mmetsp:Transcript_24450/g.78905  ORF Transcript_24450/g.78905 Transcript_24450/m.78905 type:complete len:597 (+) Transcript_24450:51-1841(+)
MSSATPWSRLSGSETLPAEQVRSVCIIGAGSSGLVSAKHLRDAGYQVTVLEKSPTLGGAFVSKAYDDSHLVSSCYLTAFSDLRILSPAKPHLSLREYTDYLSRYADEFDLSPLIRLSTTVVRVERRAAAEGGEAGGYVIHTSPTRPDAYPAAAASEATIHFDAVCVCCGLHETPFVPAIPGADSFSGVLLHSADYKDAAMFEGKRVLVVGCGESAMDIVYRAVLRAASTSLSIKTGFLAVPHDGWGGLPLDTLICNMCEHSYEHRWCHDAHLKWRLTSYVIRFMFLLMTGTSVGYSQWVGRVKNVKRGHHILCKSTKALPYLNKPHKRNSWRRFVWWWVDPPVDAEITSRPAPARIDGPTVTFVDGTRADFDVVLLATGYTQRFPFLHPPRTTHAPDPRGGATAPRGIEDPLPSDHFVVDPAEPRLAFIGFVRPNVGAIPPMAEMQSMWWIARLRGQVTAHRDPPSYGLLGRKLAYGVDYGNYMHQLAAEFGAAPAVSQLARRPRVLLAYCLGQAYISFFRLVGPFAHDKAWEVSATELFAPVRQRGLGTNLIFLVTMLAFGCVSLAALALETLTNAVGLTEPHTIAPQQDKPKRA